MIREFFIPYKIGTYYPFPKRVVGVDIGKTQVYATVLSLHKTEITIESCLEKKIDGDTFTSYKERVAKALTALFEQIGHYDALHTALSSATVVFKELTLPFQEREKIQLVLNYEVEPLLPFSLKEATINFIITNYDTTNNSSTVLVAAVQNKYIEELHELFVMAGISPTVISIDMFAFYNLYSMIPHYRSLNKSVALIDMGFATTRIAYLYHGQLRMIRTLPKGIITQAKLVSSGNSTPVSVMENLVRFGLTKEDDPAYTQEMTRAMTSFLQEIQFTLSSFAHQTDLHDGSIQLLLCGGGAQIKNITSFASSVLKMSCEQFDPRLLLTDTNYTLAPSATLNQPATLSLAIALPSGIHEYFTMDTKEFSQQDSVVLTQELIIVAALVMTLFGILIGHTVQQIHSLKTTLHNNEQQVIEHLQEAIPTLAQEFDDLEEAVEAAQIHITKEENLWFSFSNKERVSFLRYLLELHTLDKEALGLTVNQITMTNESIILKASVKDHEALKKIERDLKKSPLFTYVEPQEDTTFTMKIILNKKNREL